MANSTGKYGFVPYEGPAIVHEYDVDPAEAAMYKQQLVDLVADQGVGVHTAGNEDIIGVVAGFKDSNGAPCKYYPGGSATGYKALVYDDPNQRFMTKSTTALTAADVGSCGDLTAGTPSSAAYISGQYCTTFAASAAALQLVGLAGTEGNAWGANQDIVVLIVEHILRKAGGV